MRGHTLLRLVGGWEGGEKRQGLGQEGGVKPGLRWVRLCWDLAWRRWFCSRPCGSDTMALHWLLFSRRVHGWRDRVLV